MPDFESKLLTSLERALKMADNILSPPEESHYA